MKSKLLFTILYLLTLNVVKSQNIGINTTGAAPATTNMLEILQTATAVNTIGLYTLHSGAITGTGYGLWSEKTGASTTNVAGYFSASGATNNYALIVPSTGGRVGIGTTTPAHQFHVISGLSTGSAVYSDLTDATSGTSWTTTNARAGIMGRAASGTSSYQAGVFGYQVGTGNNSGGVVGAYNSSTWGGLGYSDGSGNNWGGFFNGNSRTTGYILAGNPSVPAGVGTANTTFYHIVMSTQDYWNYTENYCNLSTNWYVPSSNYMKYVATAGRANQRVYSPYFWIPNGYTANTAYIQINHSSNLEAGFDGVYMAYTVNGGGAWTTMTDANWSVGNYNDLTVVGSGTTCVNLNIPMWTSGFIQQTSTSTAITSTKNNWMQLRLAAAEDASSGSTLEYRVYEVWVKGTMDFYSAGFMVGGVYAEGHIYAQSSSQLGDVAEYFPVQGESKHGDLIAMDPYGSKLCHVSSDKMDPYLIGVHSSSPSVLINDPKQGIPVGLTGRVLVNITNENGIILPGDYLTSSSKKGCAMKATEPCYIIGRAIETPQNNGQVMCMLGQGWYNPNPNSEAVLFGSSFAEPLQKTTKIFDSRITRYSKIFVTMNSNPGSYFWISGVSDGYFEIEFGNAPIDRIPLDFLINKRGTENNTAPNKNLSDNNGKLLRRDKVNPDNELNTSAAWKILGNSGDVDLSRIAESFNPPSAPPDPNKLWTWDPKNGFIERQK